MRTPLPSGLQLDMDLGPATIAAFYRELDAGSRYNRFLGLVSEEGLNAHVERALRENTQFVGLRVAGELVGLAEISAAPTCEIALALRREHQGMGLGGFLFETALLVARGRGAESVTSATNRGNQPMVRLAQRVGMRAPPCYGGFWEGARQLEPDDAGVSAYALCGTPA